MKNLFLLLISTFVFTQANANDDLEASMKIIGEQFKILATGLQKKLVGEEHLAAADLLIKEVAVSGKLYPDNATSESQKLEYDTLMAELLTMSVDLKELLVLAVGESPQDLTQVTEQFIQINEHRKKGHDLFKD